MRYFELHCKSNFSFLEGASHADELIQRSVELGYAGIAISDRNTLAGIVRGHTAAKDAGQRFIVGAELHPVDGPPLVVWPTDREAYARLSRLITRGRLRREKGGCQLDWSDIAEISQGLLAGLLLRQPVPDELPDADRRLFDDQIVLPWEQGDVPGTSSPDASSRPEAADRHKPGDGMHGNFHYGEAPLVSAELTAPFVGGNWPEIEFDPRNDAPWLDWLHTFGEIFGDRGYLLAELQRGVDDQDKLSRLQWLSQHSGVPLVAGGDVYYHVPQRSLLHDCLLATRFNTTIDHVAVERLGNSQYHLRPLERLREAFAAAPDALERTAEIATRIDFNLDQLRYEYPVEFASRDERPIDLLKRLSWKGAKKRYPQGVPPKLLDMLKSEISLIEDLHYEAYFLTVWDLVRFARNRGILCQGRGSAANSAVCYCLGVTSVDPEKTDLLFERFISRERNEAPDIDVDFEHQRREEVLQYIYEKYGRHRAGMTATVITYRIRSAIRDCGRALGISLDKIDMLSKLVDARVQEGRLPERLAESGIDPQSAVGQRFLYLIENLVGFPRHLSQHTGGMVMTHGWLCELCPLENASMDGRTVIQWDKDDLDELGILKVDCLALGMLSAIHRSFDLLERHYDRPLKLATVPPEDPQVYDMICRADTLGVFQIESRAQMSMLPRLQPRCFYDLVIEVAIVRPGPIQGQMVHPYLQARRSGIQPDYPTDEIRQVLEKTMGVPLFQEQAMRLAVVAAGFTPGEADQLRRAMAAWRRPGVIDRFHTQLIDGMLAKGLSQQFAEQVFTQIRGFGEYGFPESHAASFALLVYVSCWIKHHYPDVFCTAMLNSQPLGFYAPAQLIQDARQHGVEVGEVDVNLSLWETTLEPLQVPSQRRAEQPRFRIRLGMHMIRGLPEKIAERVVEARRDGGRFRDVANLARRSGLGQAHVTLLADSGALRSLSGDRRAAYWQALAQDLSGNEMQLFEATGVDVDEALPESLQPMQDIEEVYADYETTGLSLKGHPLQFVRTRLDRLRVTPARALKQTADGQAIRVAGIVLLRQRPSTAKGITFVTLEDETGAMNLVIRPQIWERFYKTARGSNAWLVHGTLENREGVIHIVVGQLEDLSTHLGQLDTRSRDFR